MLSQHRIDRDERANEFDNRWNIFGFKRAAVAFEFCAFQFVDANDFSVFPNPGVGIVGTDATRIGPGVDRQEAVVHGGSDVHRAAVHADDEAGDANESNELQKRSLIGELDAILSHVDGAVCFANDNNARWREGETNVLDHAVGQ